MKRILVLLLLLLFSCGKKAENTEKKEVVFTFNNLTEIQSLDPQKVSGVPENRILSELFTYLMRVDPKTGRGMPGIAESYEVDSTGKIYTFKIRKDAVWTDGVPITAQTVAGSFMRQIDPKTASPYAGPILDNIKGAKEYVKTGDPSVFSAKAIDDYTFQFETIYNVPYIVDLLNHFAFSVVPLHVIEKFGDDWTKPENFVSSGPFKLLERRPNDRIIMVKNDKYFDKDSVKIDRVVALEVSDNNTAYNMFLNGEINYLPGGIPQDKVQEALLRDDAVVSVEFATYMSGFNQSRPPLNDVRVRKALALAADKKSLIDNILKLQQVPAQGIVPPLDGRPAMIDDRPFEEKVKEAQDLLSQAGFPNGAGFPKLVYTYNTNDSIKVLAEFLQEQWKKNLNIDVELKNMEWKSFLETTSQKGDYDITRRAWSGDYLDPMTFLDLFETGNPNNSSKYSNPKYDELLMKARNESDPKKRMDILAEAENFIVNEYIAMPLYFYTTLNMIDLKKWGGWYKENITVVHPIASIYPLQ